MFKLHVLYTLKDSCSLHGGLHWTEIMKFINCMSKLKKLNVNKVFLKHKLVQATYTEV